MKNQTKLSIVALLFSVSLFAQDYEAPKKGAKLYVDASQIEVNEKGESTFDVYLVKSKVARKASFETPKFLVPEGLNLTVTEDANNPYHYIVSVKADAIQQGDYSITVSGKRSGIHAVTGMILPLKVTSSTTVAAKEGE